MCSSDLVALVVSDTPHPDAALRIAGCGQAHSHQHLSAMRDVLDTGAAASAARALAEARMALSEIDLLAVYDSFTITLAMLLEEIGFAPRGQCGALTREGRFGPTGDLPLNLHGGLLSFGHSGVAGGMAHFVEVARQLRGDAGDRGVPGLSRAFIHADGGVMSAHVSMVLERTR